MPSQLYPHQLSGIDSMVKCLRPQTTSSRPRGVLLADALGLGKTRQVIGTLVRFGAQRCLLVVPASVLHHWRSEIQEMGYEGRVILLHHSETKTLPPHLQISQTVGQVLVVTTYKTFERARLWTRQWDFLALDEANVCKNPQTKISKLMKLLVKTPYKILITGTPSQNDLNELHSLFEIIDPDVLGPKDVFERAYTLPVKIGSKRGASSSQRDQAARLLQVLQRLIQPYVLRRTLSMPHSKSEVVVWSEMTSYEQSVYARMRRAKADDHVLRAVVNGMEDSMIQNQVLSGKQHTLLKMVDCFLQQDHNVAIFVNSLTFMKWLKQTIQNKHDLVVGTISGCVPCGDRQALLAAFNAKALRVLILTSRSSATGINLTCCARSIIAQGDWNSAIDDQAAARSHRLSSLVDTVVYRLITRKSLEEAVYETSLRKTTTNRALLRSLRRVVNTTTSTTTTAAAAANITTTTITTVSTSKQQQQAHQRLQQAPQRLQHSGQASQTARERRAAAPKKCPQVEDDDHFLVRLGLETESHDAIVARAALDDREYTRFIDNYRRECSAHQRTVVQEKRDASAGKLLLKQLFVKHGNSLPMGRVLKFYDVLVKKKHLAITPVAYRKNVHRLATFQESSGLWVLRVKNTTR